MDCIFCKIIKGEIPSYTLYEDDIVKVFLDANPESNGHCLIVPKKHYKDLYDIDDKTIMHIINIAKNMTDILKEKLHIDGLTLIQNNGNVQEVKHFHLHLKPQYKTNQKKLKPEEVYTIIKN